MNLDNISTDYLSTLPREVLLDLLWELDDIKDWVIYSQTCREVRACLDSIRILVLSDSSKESHFKSIAKEVIPLHNIKHMPIKQIHTHLQNFHYVIYECHAESQNLMQSQSDFNILINSKGGLIKRVDVVLYRDDKNPIDYKHYPKLHPASPCINNVHFIGPWDLSNKDCPITSIDSSRLKQCMDLEKFYGGGVTNGELRGMAIHIESEDTFKVHGVDNQDKFHLNSRSVNTIGPIQDDEMLELTYRALRSCYLPNLRVIKGVKIPDGPVDLKMFSRFPKLEVLDIHIMTKIETTIHDYKAIFPNLKTLKIKIDDEKNHKLTIHDCHFPVLENLDISSSNDFPCSDIKLDFIQSSMNPNMSFLSINS